MSAVLADTGAWIALLSDDDHWHEPVHRRYQELAATRTRLITTNYVVDETATRLRYGLGPPAALSFRRMLVQASATGRLRIAWIDERLEAEAWRILDQYADVQLSLTDATTAAVARARRVGEVFGLDRDFEALGFTVTPGS
jgi:predicted nucleic acid-binding protein